MDRYRGVKGDIAFNLDCVGYHHDITSRRPSQALAYSVLDDYAVTQFDNHTLEFPPGVPTAEELDDRARLRGMWVGMWLPSGEHFAVLSSRSKALQQGDKDWPKGSLTAPDLGIDQLINSSRGVTCLAFNIQAARVISIIDESRNELSYAVLVNPAKGLCVARKCPIDEVFFFSEFRVDYEVRRCRRVSLWADKVWTLQREKLSCKTTGRSTGASERPARHLSSRICGLLLQRNIPLAKTVDHVLSRAGNAARSNEGPQECEGPDFTDVAEEYSTITLLVDIAKPFTESNAFNALIELQSLHPDLVGIPRVTAQAIQQFAQSLRRAKIRVDHDILRPLLVHFCSRLSHLEAKAVNLDALVSECHEYVLRLLGPTDDSQSEGVGSSFDELTQLQEENARLLGEIAGLAADAIQALDAVQEKIRYPRSREDSIRELREAPDGERAALWAVTQIRARIDRSSGLMEVIRGLCEERSKLPKQPMETSPASHVEPEAEAEEDVEMPDAFK